MTDFGRTEGARWLRAAIEGAVIVGSILLAFGIEAWWDQRQERQTELVHLEAVREDVSESLSLLRASNRDFETIVSSLSRLLDEGVEGADPAAAAHHVREALFELATYEPRVTALLDLETSNDMEVLTLAVRRQVSEVNRALADLGQAQADFVDSQQGLLDPFVVSELPLEWILDVTDDPAHLEEATIPADWSALDSPRARNLMVLKRTLAGYVMQRRIELQKELVTLEALVGTRMAQLR